MEYKVLQEKSILDLEQKVNYYLKEKWQLQGGVCVTYNRGNGSNDMFYAQALVKI
jgi:hypothetical protein